jgi:hypothetical protein
VPVPLTAYTAALGVLTASDAPGAAAVVGLFDESGAPLLDESGGFILNEDGT